MKAKSTPKPGRPRQFDEDQALDRALRVFWKHGYEGTSLLDLTKAMKINRPSLYSAFGDKESLFRRVVERYVAKQSCHMQQALNEPTARRVAERIWQGGIDAVSNSSRPQGCLLVHGALACSADAKAAQRELEKRREAGETALRHRFERAVAEGDLARDTNAAGLAKFVSAVTYGMAVQSAGGASAEDLRAIVDEALKVIPVK